MHSHDAKRDPAVFHIETPQSFPRSQTPIWERITIQKSRKHCPEKHLQAPTKWLAAGDSPDKIECMNENSTELTLTPFEFHNVPATTDASANPFKLVVDPVMRMRLRKALFELIESHDAQLADYVAAGQLALDSYKEYIEIFSRSLRESLATAEGVKYLLDSCGFQVEIEEINLAPDTRWKKKPEEPEI